jgi:RNA polymerase sigma-70 factor, ECF subfamily
LSSIVDIEYLFKEYYKRLHRIAYQVVNDTDLAEDVVQEVFISVWKNKDSLTIKTTIEGYLVKATVNKAITFLEKNQRNHKTELTEQIEYIKNADLSNNNFDFELFQSMVYVSLDKLPPKCKAIFMLSRFENMKNKEIAEHLGINIKTVENQMSIAMNKLNTELKPKLKNYFPEIFFNFFLIFFNFFWG